MIGALAGKPPPDAVVDAIFSETEGNPFFVEEVFRHLAEEGKLFADGEFRTDIDVDELDVPESVRLVVGRRLERLGDEAQKVLAAGAVVGRAFPFRLLEAITDVESGRLLDVVEEAEAARVVVGEERDGEVHYSFAHELIRQTLLAGLSVLRRQRLHLAVADAIEHTDKRARQERPSEIAHHLLQAGAAADAERTLEYLELTAQRALEAAAFEDAVRAIDDALSVVDPDDRLRVAQLQERRGWAVRALGHFDECLAIWDGVVATYAERRPDRRGRRPVLGDLVPAHLAEPVRRRLRDVRTRVGDRRRPPDRVARHPGRPGRACSSGWSEGSTRPSSSSRRPRRSPGRSGTNACWARVLESFGLVLVQRPQPGGDRNGPGSDRSAPPRQRPVGPRRRALLDRVPDALQRRPP